MAEPFLGEIRLASFKFAPAGWALCDGQLMPKAQNEALFNLLKTAFGGDGVTNFALPNLCGRAVMGRGARAGTEFKFAQSGGEQTHALTLAETPEHIHALMASTSDGDTPVPAGNVLARSTKNIYAPMNNPAALTATTIASTGGSQPHDNMQPSLCITFMIAVQGISPVPPGN